MPRVITIPLYVIITFNLTKSRSINDLSLHPSHNKLIFSQSYHIMNIIKASNTTAKAKGNLRKLFQAAKLVTPAGTKGPAPQPESLDESKRHTSEYESGEEEEQEAVMESADGSGDEISIESTAATFKFVNPLKVSRATFESNPEALGIDCIDKYSTYEEYERYIDSPAGFQAEMAKVSGKLAAAATVKPAAQLTPSATTTVLANTEVYFLKGEGMGYAQCKKLKEFIARERLSQRTTNRNEYMDGAAKFNITLAFTAKEWIKAEKEWYEWDDQKFFDLLLKCRSMRCYILIS